MTPGSPSSAPRPRIGLLTRYLGDPNGNEMLTAANRAAVEQDVDLVVLAGIQWADFDSLASTPLWQGLSTGIVDGLLLCGEHLFLDDEVGNRNRVMTACALPCLSTGVMVPDHPWLCRDDEAVMRHAIEHLVTIHGYRRLQPILDQPVLTGVFERIIQALGLLESVPSPTPAIPMADWLGRLMEKDDHPDALLVSNGPVARSAIIDLQRQGWLVPDDVAVVNLQAFSLDRFMHPPVAACFPSLADLSACGVLRLAQHLRQGVPLIAERMPASFSPAASCGCCHGLSMVEDEADGDVAGRIDRRRNALLHRMIEQGLSGEDLVTIEALRPRAMVLLREFCAVVAADHLQVSIAGEPAEAVPSILGDLPRDRLLREALARSIWALQRDALPLLAGTPAESVARDLLRSWFRELDLSGYRPGYHSQIDRSTANELIGLERSLISLSHQDNLVGRCLNRCQRLGIRDLFAWVTDRSEERQTDRVILAIADGVAIDGLDGEPVGVIPRMLTALRGDDTGQRCSVVMTLSSPYTGWDGLLVIDAQMKGLILEHLRGALSAALYLAEVERENQRVRDRLAYERGLLRCLIDSVPDALYLKDQEGRFLINNQRSIELFGVDGQADLVGCSDADFLPPEQAAYHREQDQRVVETGQALEQDRDPLSAKPMLISKYPFRDVDGVIVGLVGIHRDVSDLQRAEEQIREKDVLLQRAQRFEGIARLAGGVAHDFNNILTVIQNAAELLVRGAENTDMARRAQTVVDAAQRAGRLTANLLTFASSQFLKPQSCDLNLLVRDAEDLIRGAIGGAIELRLELVADDCTVMADLTQIEQVLLNLVVNARDAMPDGGELVIGTRVGDISGRGALPTGRYVTLVVHDTGSGIAAQHLASIFDPFFTTKASGTGLGLATAYGIVRQSGGDIEVASTPGTGSTFSVHLPFIPRPDYEADVSVVAAEPVRGDETILVVDDEAVIAEIIAETLGEHGYRVFTATDGRTANRLMEEQAPIHLLITDIVMPGLDGVEFARTVQERFPKARVLFMSGMSDTAIHEIVPQPLLANFLAKPFDGTTLTEKVRTALESSSRIYHQRKS